MRFLFKVFSNLKLGKGDGVLLHLLFGYKRQMHAYKNVVPVIEPSFKRQWEYRDRLELMHQVA